MNRRVFRPYERQAYTQAAVAVAAERFRIRVRRLLIDADPCDCRPNIQSYEQWHAAAAESASDAIGSAQDYITALLAGSVGHLILQEKCFGYRGRTTGQRHLERRRRSDALQGLGWLNDQANFLAFVSLRETDQGDLDATIARLWNRAEELLRRPENRRRLERLAIRL